jgi:predicted nucleotidyltransferase
MRPNNLICETVFGSHLYGTSTEQSDRDYKGIFLPSAQDILLGRIPKTSSEAWFQDCTRLRISRTGWHKVLLWHHDSNTPF